jgi:hypothetical protein
MCRRFVHVVCLGWFLVAARGATAAECSFPHREPQPIAGGLQVFFLDSCGRPYEVGYRLEGNTLYFPGGGTHRIEHASQDEAERLLREAYGLVGERDALIRTRWVVNAPGSSPSRAVRLRRR